MKKFEMGTKVFFDGKVGTVMAQSHRDRYVIGVEEALQQVVFVYGSESPMMEFRSATPRMIEVPTDRLQLICDNVFEIGQKVESVLGGGFTGVVTGFEYETNRVICVSDKIGNYNNDRTRFAYTVGEIVKYDPKYKFNLGEKYKVNSTVDAIVVEGSQRDRLLVNAENGRLILFANKQYTKEELKREGVDNIQKRK